jgi:molecular chaperone DnaK (HSP70)
VPAGQNKTSDELVADYLGALMKHGMYILEQKLGQSLVKDTPVEFVLTVPAIWSDLAKDKTIKACQSASPRGAGTPINLVSEPVSRSYT